ncbi:MAG: phosphatidate cytidylyltransferase [Deltaproteobacteria bacterium]|nr:MAG: phosphatidate cytidylyltransferase [Deltaproteobacteria bacterium]
MGNITADKSHLHRWITAVVILPLLLVAIAVGPGWLLLVLVLLVTTGGLLEFFALTLGDVDVWLRMVALGMGLLLPLASYREGVLGLTAAITVVLFVALSVHLLIFAMDEAGARALGTVVFAQVYVPFGLSHLLLLLQQPAGRRWVVFALAVIFSGDTGAYYVGRRWGRHKLLPVVSPGKTIEGAAGGLCSSLALALLLGKTLFASHGISIGFLLALGFVLALAGQIGDLGVSMLKRLSKVKDAGGLLPGHGGLLDRLDSLLFALPATYYGVLFFV